MKQRHNIFCHSLFLVVCLGAFIVAAAVRTPAEAEVFVWDDPEYNISIVFPDDWRVQQNLNTDVRLHILAPQGRDYAACTITAKRDGRFAMYPDRYTQRINSIVFNTIGLVEHLNLTERDDVRLVHRSDYAGFGKASAVYAEAEYTKDLVLNHFPMRSLMFATLYGDMYFVFECEAASRNWPYWEPVFLNIAKSVDFPLRQHSTPNGFYRDFHNDGGILLNVDNGKTGTVAY